MDLDPDDGFGAAPSVVMAWEKRHIEGHEPR